MHINSRNLCIGCMRPLGFEMTCLYCGLKQDEYIPIPSCLTPGTVLMDKYIIGKVLDHGAFGIIYIAWDMIMDIPVAIKESFPREMVSRDIICGAGNEIYLYKNTKKKEYEDYLKKFYYEAKCLSRFNQVEGIVSVRDFFYDNNTAYIVMQYIEGISLKCYIEENGRIPGKKVLRMIRPLLMALEQVHRAGIIHRDISPDNIMIKPDQSLVLIDFGAACMRDINTVQTVKVMFKRGYSPEEQYHCEGRWGPYTDVYSICATMYFMMAGVTPMDSVIRALNDDMTFLVGMKAAGISSLQRRAVMKGLAVDKNNRWQNIDELCQALYKDYGEVTHSEAWRHQRNKIILIVGFVLILLGTMLGAAC